MMHTSRNAEMQASGSGADVLTRDTQDASRSSGSSAVTAPTSGASASTLASVRADDGVSTARIADTSAGQLRRLLNPGALCFANASMQALAAVPQVWSAVKSIRRRTAESWDAWFFDKRGDAKQLRHTHEPDFDALISAIFNQASGSEDEDPVQACERKPYSSTNGTPDSQGARAHRICSGYSGAVAQTALLSHCSK